MVRHVPDKALVTPPLSHAKTNPEFLAAPLIARVPLLRAMNHCIEEIRLDHVGFQLAATLQFPPLAFVQVKTVALPERALKITVKTRKRDKAWFVFI